MNNNTRVLQCAPDETGGKWKGMAALGEGRGQRRNRPHKNCEDEYKMALTLFMQPLTKVELRRGGGGGHDHARAQDNNGFGNSLVGFTFMKLSGRPGGCAIKRRWK